MAALFPPASVTIDNPKSDLNAVDGVLRVGGPAVDYAFAPSAQQVFEIAEEFVSTRIPRNSTPDARSTSTGDHTSALPAPTTWQSRITVSA